MVDKRRGLRPLETLKKDERELLFKQIHAEVQSYHYESQTIRLLKKEKKQREIEELLSEKMEEYKRKNSELENFSKKLKEDQEKTRKSIDERKNAIQNYDHKGKQETEKLNKENQMLISRDTEMKKKLEVKAGVLSELQEVEKKISEYSKYKSVLEKVVERSEDYEEISHLINRCRTLKKSVDNLSQQYRKLEEETETEKETFFKEFNDLSESIGQYQSLVRTLEGQIEELNSEIGQVQSKQEQQRISRIEHKAQRAKIELSIKNIYSKAMQSKPSIKSKQITDEEKKKKVIGNNEVSKPIKTNVPDQEMEDPDKLVLMLQKIRERYSDLKRINADFDKESLNSKPVIVQTLTTEEYNKGKVQKKSSGNKNLESNRTLNNKEFA